MNDKIIHYCWICDTEERCKEEKCDFRDQFRVHGNCMTDALNALHPERVEKQGTVNIIHSKSKKI